MRVHVLLGEALHAPADVAEHVVVVVDVLRAATSVAVALANGATAVHPFRTVEETRRAEGSYRQTALPFCLAGERGARRITGFDLGNSPLEYVREAVEGRTILFTTTNGTAALVAMRGAHACFFAAFVNVTETVASVCQLLQEDSRLRAVTVVCSGTDGLPALEDVVCAGRLVRGLRSARADARLSDSAQVALACEQPYREDVARLANDAAHALHLRAEGFEADVACAFAADAIPVAVLSTNGSLRPFRALRTTARSS